MAEFTKVGNRRNPSLIRPIFFITGETPNPDEIGQPPHLPNLLLKSYILLGFVPIIKTN
jgi:hypothetical protein